MGPCLEGKAFQDAWVAEGVAFEAPHQPPSPEETVLGAFQDAWVGDEEQRQTQQRWP